jgi:hypothetical protein
MAISKKTCAKAILAFCLFLVIVPANTQTHGPGASKPNVVFILADNVGYGDLGPYGGGQLRGYPTPRADQLELSDRRNVDMGIS